MPHCRHHPQPCCLCAVPALVAALAALSLPAAAAHHHHAKAGPGEHACPQSPPGPGPVERPLDAGAYGIIWGFEPSWVALPAPAVAPPLAYRAQVYHVVDCPASSLGDHFAGLDDLITLMGHEGLKLYASPTESMESGPGGIIGADDVVVIKINYQWAERGGTNVDLLRGLIAHIVEHPDAFTGEIVVAENWQFAAPSGFDRTSNNAEDQGLSPHDVVVAFQGAGHDVSHFDWAAIRYTSVGEYSAGDLVDGYVVYDYDPQLNGRVSYPKFQTDSGTHVSLRDGIWDSGSGVYDRGRLKLVNMPVLKSHHSTYGITACVKNYMGVVTGQLSTNSHNAIRHGVLGALLGEIRPADLNLLDCIWINANPFSGPSTSYGGATRRDELVASVDPVAADMWAAQNILIPAFIDNGYPPPWPEPNADPDDPASDFREYLDNSMAHVLNAGFEVTNDPDQIEAYTWSAGGDLDLDGVDDGLDNCPYDANPLQADCDGDEVGDVCAIREGLSADVNANGVPDECECLADVDGSGAVNVFDLLAVLAVFGEPGGPEDITGDGIVDVFDLLALLAVFGQPCPTP